MISVYCCDVGSVKKNAFGWAKVSTADPTRVETDTNIDNMIAHVGADLREGRKLALGFESPLFIPAAQTLRELSCGRDGDRDRSCFAPAGGYVALLGLHELLYVLARTTPLPRFTLDWLPWRETGTDVLLWEAFVSGKAHTKKGEHCQDAATAAVAFLESLETGFALKVEVRQPRLVFSLAGAALLWAGASTDLSLLSASTLVIKPDGCFAGGTVPAQVLGA